MSPTARTADPVDGVQGTHTGLLRGLGILLGVIGAGGYLWWLVTAAKSPVWGWDFRAYYAAIHALPSGGNLYELSSPTNPAYLYPPLLAFLLFPLGTLSLPAATLVWDVLQHLCLLASGALLIGLTENGLPDWQRVLRGGLVLFLWGIGVPLRDEIYLGQVNSLALVLLLGALVVGRPWVRNEQPIGPLRLVVAGLLLGLSISIKVQPILLLPYFALRGSWRLAVSGGLGFVLLQAATIPFTNSTLDYWLNLFPDLLGRSESYIDNQSINGFLSRWLLPGAFPDLPRFDNYVVARRVASQGANLLVLLGAGIVLVVPFFVRLRHKRNAFAPLNPHAGRLSMLLEIALILLSINLTSYVTWPHHEIWWVMAALALLSWWLLQGRIPTGGVVILGVVAVIFSHAPNDWPDLVDVQKNPYWAAALSSMNLYAVILLWGVVAVTLVRHYRTELKHGSIETAEDHSGEMVGQVLGL